MKISIITPVYNTAHTLERTILSVINQKTTAEVEYVVVDGGSTDGSLDILHRYANRIAKIISEPDHGIYDAMNKGIAAATGDVIGIINADDWYNDNALMKVEECFRNNSEIGIVYSPIDNYFDGDYRNTYVPGALENLRIKFTLNHPSCFVRKSVYERLEAYDLGYAIAGDYDFIFRAYCAGVAFHYIDQSLASYSLDGLSSLPMNRIKLIQESWLVGAPAANQSSLKRKRLLFYLNWIAKEVLTLPIKKLIKPQTIGKIKALVRQVFGKFPTDEYGAW